MDDLLRELQALETVLAQRIVVLRQVVDAPDFDTVVATVYRGSCFPTPATQPRSSHV